MDPMSIVFEDAMFLAFYPEVLGKMNPDKHVSQIGWS